MNQLSFVKQVLYKLKRAYGYPVTLYRLGAQEINVESGAITTVKTKHRIAKAVILPSALARKFSYDLSYIAANKNFSYGGFYDVGSRLIVIDGKDLPRGFELQQDDYLVHDKKAYQLTGVEALVEHLGYLVTGKEQEGMPAFEVLDESVQSTLTPAQGAQ